MPHTRSLTAVVFFITLSPLFRCFLCNQVASRRRGFWEDQVMPGLIVNANVPSRRTVCLCTGRFRTCLFGLASRSKVTIPCDHTARRSVLPHIRRLVLHVLSKTDAALADANTKLFRQMSGLAPGGKDDNVDEYFAFERFFDPSYGWRAWNRRSDLF